MLLTTSALIAATLLTGIVISTWQAIRANRSEAAAEQAEAVAKQQRDAALVAEIEALHDRDRARDAEQRASDEKQNAEASLQFLLADVLEQASPFSEPNRELTGPALMLDQAANRLEEHKSMPPLVKASILQTMGSIYIGLGELDEAERHLTEAYALQREHADEYDPATLTTAYNLAELYWFQSDYSRAEPLYERVIEGRMRLFGEDGRETLLATNAFAHLYSFRDEPERAVPLLTKALQTSRRLYGPYDLTTLTLSRSLGNAYLNGGHYAEAEGLLVPTLKDCQCNWASVMRPRLLSSRSWPRFTTRWAALTIRNSTPLTFTSSAPRYSESRNAHTLFSEALLAMLHLARGRIDEARPLYRDFLDKCMLNKNVCRRL